MVFCVEDDVNIRKLIIYTLESTGFEAKGFEDGRQLFDGLKEQTPDLVILDIMLPGMDGMEILSRMKKDAELEDIPVIMATAKGTESDKVQGLDAGADDYITKPFGMLELVSRVKAVLRRSQKYAEASGDIVKVKGISINLKKHEVLAGGEIVALTLKEYELLKHLMQNINIVMTRDHLLADIWGYDYVGETRTLDVHIRTLRQKLGEYGEQIETIRGVGYIINQ